MSIATRITSIEEHIGDIYDTLELGGAFLLPTGYTQLDYIESTGTQYIDTGFKPSQNTSVEIEGNQTGFDVPCSMFGSNPYFVITSSSTKYRFRYNSNVIDTTLLATTKAILKLDKNNAYINNTLVGTFTASTFLADYTTLLFARHSKYGEVEECGLSRIYYCKIWDNGTLTREYIPCKNASNEIGLYDLVTKTFFGNSGTGTFTAGPATLNKNLVNVKPILKQKYLDYMNNGTQEIWNNWEKVPTATGENVTLNNTVQAPMDVTVKGNSEQNGTPSPTNEVPIQNVTGDVEVLVQNKNLALNDDPENPDANYVSSGGGTQPVQYSSTEGGYYTPGHRRRNFGLLKAGTYTISLVAKTRSGSSAYAGLLRHSNGTLISSLPSINSLTNNYQRFSVTFTLTNDEEVYWIIYETMFFKDIQLEQNTTVSTYTPHKEQTYTFPLGTQRMYLGDYLADDGIHHVRKQVTFDGSSDENWSYYSNGGVTNRRFIITIDDMKMPITTQNQYPLLCNRFLQGSNSSNENFICGLTNYKNIWVGSTELESLDTADFKTWLSTHNVTVEYELAEEEITPYTTEQQTAYDEIKQALSYYEQTNISGTSDELNPIFTVIALKNI